MAPHTTAARESRAKERRRRQPVMTPLQTMRAQRGYSLDDVAACCDCGRSVASLWERGLRDPTAPYRKKYATMLGLTVGELGRLVYEAREKALEKKA